MQTSIRRITSTNQEQIACVAYGLWEKAGRPAGRDLEFWFKAEQQIIARVSQPRMLGTTPNEQSPKDSPLAAAASAPATTAFEWKSRSQMENLDQPGDGSPHATPARVKRSATSQPPRSQA